MYVHDNAKEAVTVCQRHSPEAGAVVFTSVHYHDSMLLTARAMLFDLDGVVVDSTPAITRVWTQWAIAYGFEPEKTVREAHGRPSIESLRDLLPDADHEALNREMEQREIEDLEGVVALPGALALLGSLPADRWAIVTSCTRALAEVRIRAAGLPVPSILVTSSETSKGKPHPEPYLAAAKALGFEPAACLVVEDVPAGIRSGKAAGARVIALRTTAPDADLRAAGADWLVDDCASIAVTNNATAGMLQIKLS